MHFVRQPLDGTSGAGDIVNLQCQVEGPGTWSSPPPSGGLSDKAHSDARKLIGTSLLYPVTLGVKKHYH